MIKKLYEKIVILRYVNSGLSYGNLETFSLNIKLEEIHRKRYHFWKRRYIKLGYHPIEDELWIWIAYGQPFHHLLKIKA